MARAPRIAFFGTAQFAVPALQYLIDSGHLPLFVVTQPDRPAGRGRKAVISPVKIVATGKQLPIFQPESVKSDTDFRVAMEGYAVDVVIVAAFGQILPQWLLDWPRLGVLNLHGSLLPKWRGAAPIQWSIIHGETETGVSLMEVVLELDAGNVIDQAKVKILPEETYGELAERLSHLSADLLRQYLQNLSSHGKVASIPQDPLLVTLAPRIQGEDTLIDWQQSATVIDRKVRGLNPKPLAVTSFRGERLKLLKTRPLPEPKGQPGSVLSLASDHIVVATGEGAVALERVIPPNRGAMDGGSFARGAQIKVGEKFE